MQTSRKDDDILEVDFKNENKNILIIMSTQLLHAEYDYLNANKPVNIC